MRTSLPRVIIPRTTTAPAPAPAAVATIEREDKVSTDEARRVSDAIWQQITPGALMRCGARDFGFTRDERGGLTFRITATTKGGARRIMRVMVTLTHADTYRIEVWRKVGKYGTELAASHDGIYADQLARLVQVEAGEFRSQEDPSWDR